MPLPKSLCVEENKLVDEWPEGAFNRFKKNERLLQNLARAAGSGSDRYKAARLEIENLISQNIGENLYKHVVSFNHVKAALDIARETEAFGGVSFNKNFLESLMLKENDISKLSLLNLIGVYFDKYDSLVEQDNIGDVCSFVKLRLSELREGRKETQLSRFKNHAPVLFDVKGPQKLVQRAVDLDVNLDTVFKELGIGHVSSGDFLEFCNRLYYVEMLRSIPLGEQHNILNQVTSKNVYKLSVNQNRRVGHEVLEILIERSAKGGAGISEAWLDAILLIAGDPRVPKTARRYMDWWAHISEENISRVRGWMSKVDLRLFLDVLEESATDADMQRMYADRKTVIEGLDNLGVIDESRLFLSGKAERYLKRMKDVDRLPNYKSVNSADTSMIYLRLGSKHIIEGTHSFSLKIMDKLPSKLPIWDYTKEPVTLSMFRGRGFENAWVAEFGSLTGFISKVHDQRRKWVNALITELRKAKINVTESDIVAASKRQQFIRDHGKRSRLRGK